MEETTTFDASAFTAGGTPRERVSLPPATFDGTVNMPVMHKAVKAFLANQRQGNASTKTRGFVIGGNQKPWKQKGTGRARQGSTRAPNWPGGGTVFGPLPRAYDEYVPSKMRTLAKKSALNARAREIANFVIEAFGWTEPRTSGMVALLERLGVAGQKALVLTDGAKTNVYLSGRNLPNVQVLPYSDASTYHILWSDVVLIEAPAIGQTLAPVAEKEAAPRARKTAAPAKQERTTSAKKSAAAKPASKPAAKAAPAKKKTTTPARSAKAKPAAGKPAAKKIAKPAAKAAAKKPSTSKPKKKGK
jgi:large subunit ribosomal protein L4